MKLVAALLGVFLMTSNIIAEPVQGWDYQYEVHLAGKKSESISGKLLYRENDLPKAFEHVITPVGEFVFGTAMGWSGVQLRWSPAVIKSDGTLDFALTDAEAKRILSGNSPTFRKCPVGTQGVVVSTEAYIPGKFEERPKQAGPDWFYVVKPGWWVNPKKMDEVGKKLPQK